MTKCTVKIIHGGARVKGLRPLQNKGDRTVAVFLRGIARFFRLELGKP